MRILLIASGPGFGARGKVNRPRIFRTQGLEVNVEEYAPSEEARVVEILIALPSTSLLTAAHSGFNVFQARGRVKNKQNPLGEPERPSSFMLAYKIRCWLGLMPLFF